MGLSNDLISQFAKITNDNKTNQTESTVYGTVSIIDGRPWVKFDGSDRLTPANTTAAVAEGERVTVLVKDHSATITGNVSSPAARDDDVKELGDKIDEFDTIVADKIKAETAEIETAIITKLDGKYATFESLDATYASITSLESAEADIDKLQADNVVINEKITARDAEIDQLKADSLTVEVADAKYATIENLEGTNAKFNNLESTYGEFVDLTTDKFEAIEGAIQDLDVESLNARYANIDFSNIGQAAMENFYANSGLIKNVVVGDQTITGELVGVTIRGDRIIGGSIVADKLVIKGDDGIYYKLNAEGGATPDQLATEEFKNGLHGSNIIANSITAEKIKVDDLVAFDATIGNFNIGDNSIYSGAKASVDNTTRGIYMDTDGQLNFGDANNYLKYYKDQNGNYKLDISASSLKFGTSGKNVEQAINDVQNSVNNIQVGGRNLALGTADFSGDGWNIKSNSYVTDITYKGLAVRHRNGAWNHIGVKVTLEPGEYVFSAYAKTDGSTVPGLCVQRNSAASAYVSFGSSSAQSLGNITSEWKRVYITFSITQTCEPWLSVEYNAADGPILYYCGFKVEKGNKATDWTPAPEDIDSKFDLYSTTVEMNSAIEQKADDIRLEVSTQITGVKSTKSVSGSLITLKDSSDGNLIDLNIYGETTKSGTQTLDTPLDFVSVGDNGSFDVSIYGKNLFDITSLHPRNAGQGGTVSFNGDIASISSASQSWAMCISDTMVVEKGKTYILSFEITNYSATTNTYLTARSSSGVEYGSKNFTANGRFEWAFTPTSDTLILSIISNGSGTTGVVNTFMVSKAQLEPGSTATDYESCNRQTLNMSYVIRSVPDTDVKDKIEFSKGVLIENVYNKIFTGTESFALRMDTSGGGYYFEHTDYDVKRPINDNTYPNAICNRLPLLRELWNVDTTGFWISSVGGHVRLRIDGCTTVAQLQAKLKEWYDGGNPLIILTERPTPIEISLSDEELAAYAALHTNSPNTTIFVDESPELYVEYFRNTEEGKTLAKKAASIQVISDRINSNVKTIADSTSASISEAESNIEQLSNQISTLVQDGSGKSLMVQTSTGWTFSMGSFEDALNNLLSHIVIGTYNNQPCLELTVDGSKQRLMLTNTDIRFMESNTTAAYITGDTMNIDNATVDNKFSINGYEWSRDSDDTLNLVFK